MLRSLNLLVAFLLELAVLLAVAYWGFQLAGGWAWLAGLGMPVVFAALWGRFAAPRAGGRLQGASGAAFQIGWFACGAAGLILAGQPAWGIALAVVYAIDSVSLLAARD